MNAPIQIAAQMQRNGTDFKMTYRPGVGVAGGPSGDPNYVPGVGKVNRDNRAVMNLEFGNFNATSGNPGSIRPGGQLHGLGSTGGSSGAVRPGQTVGQGGLGAQHGNPGVISGGGSIPGGLGGTSGSTGAVNTGRPVGQGGLGAQYGNPGVISAGGRPVGLGNISGNSGAINRPDNNGLIVGNLGATSGNPGAITSGRPVGQGGLGATHGNSGSITHGGGQIQGLHGAFGGSPGVVSHTGGTIPGGLGATRPWGSGGNNNSGAGNSSVGGSGARPFGGSRRNPRNPKKLKRPKPVDGCCGEAYTGVMTLDVEYRFDRWGNVVAPKVNVWKAEINGQPWTPPNWEGYTGMPSPDDPVTTATEQTFYQNDPWGQCLSIKFDALDTSGRLLARTYWQGANGTEVALSATGKGESITAIKAGLTS
jgi:hypothetical protein